MRRRQKYILATGIYVSQKENLFACETIDLVLITQWDTFGRCRHKFTWVGFLCAQCWCWTVWPVINILYFIYYHRFHRFIRWHINYFFWWTYFSANICFVCRWAQGSLLRSLLVGRMLTISWQVCVRWIRDGEKHLWHGATALHEFTFFCIGKFQKNRIAMFGR